MGDCFAPLGPPLLPWDLMAQTNTQNHGHGDSMTNSAQWGRVGEKGEDSYIAVSGLPLYLSFVWRRKDIKLGKLRLQKKIIAYYIHISRDSQGQAENNIDKKEQNRDKQ